MIVNFKETVVSTLLPFRLADCLAHQSETKVRVQSLNQPYLRTSTCLTPNKSHHKLRQRLW
jgi:hypothetical protein